MRTNMNELNERIKARFNLLHSRKLQVLLAVFAFSLLFMNGVILESISYHTRQLFVTTIEPLATLKSDRYENKKVEESKHELKLTETKQFEVMEGFGEMVREKPDIKDREHLNILVFGGSISLGGTLDDPDTQSYPNILRRLLCSNRKTCRVDNLAVASEGSTLPAFCLQSLTDDPTGFVVEGLELHPDRVYDVILLEFSLGGVEELELLIYRLSTRFPKALIVFIDLHSPYNFDAEQVRHDHHKHILPTIAHPSRHQAYRRVIEMPFLSDTSEELKMYSNDSYHLNALGHYWVATRVLGVFLDSTLSMETHLGPWTMADSCFSWLTTGRHKGIAEMHGGRMNPILSLGLATEQRYFAYEIEDEAILVFPSYDKETPLYMTFIAEGDKYPAAKIYVDKEKPFFFNPRTSSEPILQTVKVGTLPFWKTVVRIQVQRGEFDFEDIGELGPLRLVGYSMRRDESDSTKSGRGRAAVKRLIPRQ